METTKPENQNQGPRRRISPAEQLTAQRDLIEILRTLNSITKIVKDDNVKRELKIPMDIIMRRLRELGDIEPLGVQLPETEVQAIMDWIISG